MHVIVYNNPSNSVNLIVTYSTINDSAARTTIRDCIDYYESPGPGYEFSLSICKQRHQPRPQGFSLKKWVGREKPHPFFKGKALGTRLQRHKLL